MKGAVSSTNQHYFGTWDGVATGDTHTSDGSLTRRSYNFTAKAEGGATPGPVPGSHENSRES